MRPQVSQPAQSPARRTPAAGAERCRRRFLRIFPDGFRDADYVALERAYKVEAHRDWRLTLPRERMQALIGAGEHPEVAQLATRVEARVKHSMLFSFEKMALRDAIRTNEGARRFALGLHAFLYGERPLRERFEAWVEAVEGLPRRQTRVLTWPMVTVWGFLAAPREHFFFKPMVTRRAAELYGFDLPYRSRPNWETYAAVLALARQVRHDQRDLGPRDMIDAQSFLWVQGSDEYA
jgi:hypothetical protein